MAEPKLNHSQYSFIGAQPCGPTITSELTACHGNRSNPIDQTDEPSMRGADTFTESLFTMRHLDDFLPADHPLRVFA